MWPWILGQGHLFSQILLDLIPWTFQPNMVTLGLSVFQKNSFKCSNTQLTSVNLNMHQGYLFSQTFLCTFWGTYQLNIMILRILVLQNKSFKGFNTFDLCDLESGSKSFLFATLSGFIQGTFLPNLVTLGLSVFQKKSF